MQAELQWENYPPTTERERALPWYHERFRYKGLDDNLEEAVEKGMFSLHVPTSKYTQFLIPK